jgi:HTH-type transcriptional regulator / antitoxin HipB
MIVRTPKELGQLIKEHRGARGLTQAALAAQVGVSRKWIIDLESGKRTTDLSLVLRTLNVLGVELDARARPARPTNDTQIDIDAVVAASKRGRR